MVRKNYSLAAFSIGLFVFACPHYGQPAAILPTTRQAIEDRSIGPFKVQVPQAALDDLRRRIRSTRWPDKETDPSQGVPLAKLWAPTGEGSSPRISSKKASRSSFWQSKMTSPPSKSSEARSNSVGNANPNREAN